MTILDFASLIKRHAKLFAAIMIACALVFSVYAYLKPPTYKAVSSVKVTDSPKGASECIEGFTEPSGCTLDIEIVYSKKTVYFYVESKDEAKAIDGANQAGTYVYDAVLEKMPEKEPQLKVAESAQRIGANIPSYTIAGLFGGLCLACLIAVAYALIKKPIMSVKLLEEKIEVPCLGRVNTKKGESWYQGFYQQLKEQEQLKDQKMIPVMFVGNSDALRTFANNISYVAGQDTVRARVFLSYSTEKAKRFFSYCGQREKRGYYLMAIDSALPKADLDAALGETRQQEEESAELLGFVLV